jgi:hypothetical protein
VSSYSAKAQCGEPQPNSPRTIRLSAIIKDWNNRRICPDPTHVRKGGGEAARPSPPGTVRLEGREIHSEESPLDRAVERIAVV